MNREYARQIIQTLLEWGVAEFYVCAGARNIPLVETLLSIQSDEKIVFNHFEERSAAFYALGRIKSLKKPVAVVTTSGTAVAELLPAVMEAYYSGLPLVLLTADRPRSFRGTGAPQSAQQNNIFGMYVSKCFDLESLDDLKHFSSELLNNEEDKDLYPHFQLCNQMQNNKPLHINVCFDASLQSGVIEPIILSKKEREKQRFKSTLDKTKKRALYVNLSLYEDVKKLNAFIKNSTNIIVIISKMHPDSRNQILKFVKNLNCPVYAESISNLRECSEFSELHIHCADDIWKNEKKSAYYIDAIIKIGGTPTHRIWRDLTESRQEIKVFSIYDLPFPGIPNAEHITTCLNCFFQLATDTINQKSRTHTMDLFLQYDKQSYQENIESLHANCSSEQKFIHELSKKIKSQSRVYLGNSLPIRHWDACATHDNKNLIVEASRGLNGIDGQISTFLGFADDNCENWGIFGDLTTLYDLAGFWILNQRPNLNINIVIINNRGGKIFNKILFGTEATFIQNEHNMTFEHLAKMWSLSYKSISDAEEFNDIETGKNLIEFRQC